MILLTHPTGNTFSRALLAALLNADRLGLFATTIAFRGDEFWLKLLPETLRNELLRRKYQVPAGKVFTAPTKELLRLLGSRVGASFHVDAIYRDLDRTIARRLSDFVRGKNITGVYAYEDGACETFSRARDLGLKRFYDLPIAYWETRQRLLREEAERWPEWAPTLTGLSDSPEKNARKSMEADLADVIICPSQFVRKSLPAALKAKSIVAEFGSPMRPTPPLFRPLGKRLRVLFAGSMTQRKGLADVFAAMKLLKRADIELVILGSLMAPMQFYRDQFADFAYEAPRPHAAVLKLMETCDVLVLPSIVEGRALVQQEAMTCGLPVITTANAGAQELFEDGRAGFLVPIRSPEAIAERVAWMADNPDAVAEMKRAAFEKSQQLTWRNYSDKILAAICATDLGGQPGAVTQDTPQRNVAA